MSDIQKKKLPEIYIEEMASEPTPSVKPSDTVVKKGTKKPKPSMPLNTDINPLIQGIIYSEILGQPRSRRKFRR